MTDTAFYFARRREDDQAMIEFLETELAVRKIRVGDLPGQVATQPVTRHTPVTKRRSPAEHLADILGGSR